VLSPPDLCEFLIVGGGDFLTEFFCQGLIGWLNQDGAIREDDGRHAAEAFIGRFYELLRIFVLIDVDKIIADLVLIKKTPRTPAITAPVGAIDDDLVWHDPSIFSECNFCAPSSRR